MNPLRVPFFLLWEFWRASQTFTQKVFCFSFAFGGPLLGIASAFLVYRGSRQTRALAASIIAFMFTMLAAYTGWLFGGLVALESYPAYPDQSPGELMASLFTLPGFVSGSVATVFMVRARIDTACWKMLSILLLSLALLLTAVLLALLVMFPRAH